MRRATRILGLLLLAALHGCADKLPKATEIVHMRILGSKLEVVGDETRTSPKPGESLRVSMVTVFPKLAQNTDNLHSIFISCTAPTRFTGGVPVCQEFLDAASQGGTDLGSVLATQQSIGCKQIGEMREFGGVRVQCVAGDPVADVVVAKDFKASQKLLIGVVCQQGDPFVDPSDPLLFGCNHNPGETIRLNAQIAVQQHAADENHNPSADAIGLSFEVTADNGWGVFDPSLMPPEQDCVALSGGPGMLSTVLPLVDYLQHTLTLSYLASKREKVNGVPEDLELTVYATSGKLERRFTLFDGSDKPNKQGLLEDDLDWDPPSKDLLPLDRATGRSLGKLVRFFITVRDHRGGFAMTTRAACVSREDKSVKSAKDTGAGTSARRDAGVDASTGRDAEVDASGK